MKLLDTWEPRTVYIKPPENETLKIRGFGGCDATAATVFCPVARRGGSVARRGKTVARPRKSVARRETRGKARGKRGKARGNRGKAGEQRGKARGKRAKARERRGMVGRMGSVLFIESNRGGHIQYQAR